MSSQRKQSRDARYLHQRWQVVLFAIGASAISLSVYWYHQLYQPQLLESLDQRSRDIVFRLREPPTPPPEVVIVAIDEPSVKVYGRWPWPRALVGDLISRLKQVEVGTIALDIVFARNYANQDAGQLEDEKLIQALQAPGAPVVGGYFFRNHRSALSDEKALDQLYDNRIKIKLIGEGGHTNGVAVYPFAETNLPHIAQHFAGLGAFNRNTDIDGLVRRAPLLVGYEDEFFPTLGLQALAVYLNLQPGLIAAAEGITAVQLSAPDLGVVEIPVDPNASLRASFYEQSRNRSDASLEASVPGIPIYSAADVLSGQVGFDELADRLIFIGITEIGIGDLLPTPVNNLFPGVEMHATVAANILQEEYLFHNWDTLLLDILMITAIPLLAVIIMVLMRNLLQMFVVVNLFAVLVWMLFYWLVAEKSQLVSLLYPFGALSLAFVAFGTYFIMTSQRTTKFLTNAFGSYVSPDLVDQLMKNPDKLGLSGDKREVSVLFSDIRSFTTISEKLEPERLVSMLNTYFDAMTDTILSRQGTLDKYIGDAIMAIFNAPLPIDAHEKLAARAALDMLVRLEQMRPEILAEYDVELKIGIGLHCGEVVVGNLGSSQRFDYTVIGDAVNLAARVESITKMYGSEIIVTEHFLNQLDNEFITRPLDLIQVKGKTVPVTIHELMPDTESNRMLSEQFSKVFSHYLARRFEKALALLQSLRKQYTEDKAIDLYIERCNNFIQQPPDMEWDGVYVATSK